MRTLGLIGLVLSVGACGSPCPDGFVEGDGGLCVQETPTCPEGQTVGEAGFCVDVPDGDDSDGGDTDAIDTLVLETDTDDTDEMDTDVLDTEGGDSDGVFETDTDVVFDTNVMDMTDSPLDTGETDEVLDTGETDEPIDTSAPSGPVLDGRVYVVDMSTVVVTQPPFVGAILLGLFSTAPMLEVLTTTGSTIDLRMGAADQATSNQLLDIQTYDLLGADFTNVPWFSYDTPALSMVVMGSTVNVHDVHLQGRFAPATQQIVQGSLSGNLDTSGLAPLFGGAAAGTCNLIVTFGILCAPCPNGGGNYCVEIETTSAVANEVPGPLTQVPVTGPNASCATGGLGAVPWMVLGLAVGMRRRKEDQ